MGEVGALLPADPVASDLARIAQRYLHDVLSLRGPFGVPWLWWIVAFLVVWKYGVVRLWLWAVYADEGPRLWRYLNPLLSNVVAGIVLLTMVGGVLLFATVALMDSGIVLYRPGEGFLIGERRPGGPAFLLLSLAIPALVAGGVGIARLLRSRFPWLFAQEERMVDEVDYGLQGLQRMSNAFRDIAAARQQRWMWGGDADDTVGAAAGGQGLSNAFRELAAAKRKRSVTQPARPLVEPVAPQPDGWRKQYYWRETREPAWLKVCLEGIKAVYAVIGAGFAVWLFDKFGIGLFSALVPGLAYEFLVSEYYPPVAVGLAILLMGVRNTMVWIAEVGRRYREYHAKAAQAEVRQGHIPDGVDRRADGGSNVSQA